MISETVFDKQHYIDQMQSICKCIMDGKEQNLTEIIVDNFAGGGGASTGIEMATGYSVYAAINHDPEAIRMHMANHPSTKHFCESVWDIDPLVACDGKPVGLAWFSPDCKHFSKAKGGKPKDKSIRGLAWVALRWAGTVRPRVIMMENVEEFKTWGPLNRSHRPIKSKRGATFNKFVSQLQKLGYQVEFKNIIAADHGAPTMRKRFFIIARCDGQPILWPKPTHAPRESEVVKTGMLEPYIGAHTQIDFTRPCPSIFDTAEDIKTKYGVRAQRPLAQKTMQRIARGLQKFVIDNAEPFIVQVNNNCDGVDVKEPIPTITAGGGHFGEVRSFLIKYYGQGTGQDIKEPLDTITANDRFGLVTIKGVDYAIVDIGLRMLEPRELYGCQGFPDDYIIDHDGTGKAYPRSEQVKRCGNAVCPPIPAALVRANLIELCRGERMPNMRIDDSDEQLRFN